MSEETEIILRRAVALGSNAKQILDNPLWDYAKVVAERALFERWKGTQTSEVEDREKLWAEMNALHLVQQTLEAFLYEGEEAVRKLQGESAENDDAWPRFQ